MASERRTEVANSIQAATGFPVIGNGYGALPYFPRPMPRGVGELKWLHGKNPVFWQEDGPFCFILKSWEHCYENQ
jgi:hypothetical protein